MEDKIVSYVYVSCCGSISSVGEERAFFCYRLLVVTWFLLEGVPLPLLSELSL